MSTSNVVAAVSVAVDLLGLAARFANAAQQVSSMVARAQSEGRDLTDEEWNYLRNMDAVARARLVKSVEDAAAAEATAALKHG